MSTPDASGNFLNDWYRGRIGEATTDDEVAGYWMFLLGLVVAVIGVLTFLPSTFLERGEGMFYTFRQLGYVLAALGLPLMLQGFIVRLPLRQRATRIAYVGVGICSLAIVWFVLAFPEGWSTTGGGTATYIIVLYAVGLLVLGVGGLAVPLLTGPAPATRIEAAEARAETADAAAAEAGSRASAAAARAEGAERELGEREAYLAELEASQARFELYEDRAEKWRWRLRHRNGNIVADSGQGYSSKGKAQQGLNSVRYNAHGAPLVRIEPEPEEPVPVEEDVTAAENPPEDLAPLGSESQAEFELYEDRADEWRWRLVHDNGNVIADSGEGYSSKRKARQGLASVRRNAPVANYLRIDPTAFEVFADADGRWRWRLVHRNGNVLADSGQGYSRRRDTNRALERLADNADEDSFEVYEDRGGEWRWRLVHDNGNILADSGEGYSSRNEAENAVDRVLSHIPETDRLDIGDAAFELYEDRGDEWRWRLRHRNGNIIADSGEGYSSRTKARDGIESVKRNVPAAEVTES